MAAGAVQNIADDAHPITIGATLLSRVGISLIEIGNTNHTGLKAANSPLSEPIP